MSNFSSSLVNLGNIGHGWFPVSNSSAELVSQVFDGVQSLATISDMEDCQRCAGCCISRLYLHGVALHYHLVVPYSGRYGS